MLPFAPVPQVLTEVIRDEVCEIIQDRFIESGLG